MLPADTLSINSNLCKSHVRPPNRIANLYYAGIQNETDETDKKKNKYTESEGT